MPTALEHPDVGAHKCLSRSVAASKDREDVLGYSPLQHSLGRALGLDGRFYTPEYEALLTVQAELVDETNGNNIKRMQDSDDNFLRWTYQNRVSRALNCEIRSLERVIGAKILKVGLGVRPCQTSRLRHVAPSCW